MILILLTFLNTFQAQAGATPCHFITPTEKGSYAYDIGKAYQAATVVLIARAQDYVKEKPQLVRVVRIVKGKADSEIKLEGIHSAGTDPWGAAIDVSKDFLLFLAGGPLYKWVDQGSGCSNVYEVHDGKVKIGKTEVRLENLKQFFESNPPPI